MQTHNLPPLNEDQLNAVTGAGISFMHNPDNTYTNWPAPADSPHIFPDANPILFGNVTAA